MKDKNDWLNGTRTFGVDNFTPKEYRRQRSFTYGRKGESKHPNCECGSVLRLGAGQICVRCGCLHCTRCTRRTPEGPTCDGCIPGDEQRVKQYPTWRKK